jgi:hypothetical protein
VKFAFRKEKQILDTNANINISSTNFIEITWQIFLTINKPISSTKNSIVYVFLERIFGSKKIDNCTTKWM